MSLMLGIQMHKNTLFHTEVADITCRTQGVRVRPRAILLMKHHRKIFWGLEKACFLILKRMARTHYRQVLIVVAAIILQNYIKQKAQKDWLFEKYGNDEPYLVCH